MFREQHLIKIWRIFEEREREREVGFIDKKHIHGAKELLLLQVKSFKSQNNNIPKISQFLLYLWFQQRVSDIELLFFFLPSKIWSMEFVKSLYPSFNFSKQLSSITETMPFLRSQIHLRKVTSNYKFCSFLLFTSNNS